MLILLPLLLTIVLELIALLMMGERSRRVLLASVPINISTNLPLNLVAAHVDDITTTVVVGEVVVVVVEALCYFWLLRDWRRAFVYSLLCNAFSFLAGLLLELTYVRFVV